MADLIETGVTWLHQQRETHLVKSVTYCRGASNVTINATKGKTETNVVDREGVEVRGQIDDWIIKPAELVIDGVTVFPQQGDQIRDTVDGQTVVYEVAKGPDGHHWRYTDNFRLAIRVHAVRVAIA
jgi:hypothetical protein